MDEREMVELVDDTERLDERYPGVVRCLPLGSISEAEFQVANLELRRRGSAATVLAADITGFHYRMDRP